MTEIQCLVDNELLLKIHLTILDYKLLLSCEPTRLLAEVTLK